MSQHELAIVEEIRAAERLAATLTRSPGKRCEHCNRTQASVRWFDRRLLCALCRYNAWLRLLREAL